MEKSIIVSIDSRQSFFHLLENNTGLIVLKLGAAWCGPCSLIKSEVEEFFVSSPIEVICGDIDIDESADFYSFWIL